MSSSEEPNAETVLGSHHAFQGRLLGVRVDRVRVPGGRETSREIVEHPGAVGIVPIDEQGNVWLVRQWRSGPRAVLLNLPAGLCEPGEQPAAAAARELREEVGVEADRFEQLAAYYPSASHSEEHIELFLARGLQPVPGAVIDSEIIEPVRLPLDAALAELVSGQIRDAMTFIGLLLARDHLRPGPGQGSPGLSRLDGDQGESESRARRPS